MSLNQEKTSLLANTSRGSSLISKWNAVTKQAFSRFEMPIPGLLKTVPSPPDPMYWIQTRLFSKAKNFAGLDTIELCALMATVDQIYKGIWAAFKTLLYAIKKPFYVPNQKTTLLCAAQCINGIKNKWEGSWHMVECPNHLVISGTAWTNTEAVSSVFMAYIK